MKQIIVLKLGKIQRRLQETHKLALTYDPALVDEVAAAAPKWRAAPATWTIS